MKVIDQSEDTLINYIIILACLIVAVFLSIWLFFMVKPIFGHLDWPEAEGRILSTMYELNFEAYDEHHNVKYTYTVSETEYINRKISFMKNSYYFWDMSSREQYNRPYYEKGDVVTVYYDPKDPEESVLKKGIDCYTFIYPVFILIGAIFFITCVCWFVISIKLGDRVFVYGLYLPVMYLLVMGLWHFGLRFFYYAIVYFDQFVGNGFALIWNSIHLVLINVFLSLLFTAALSGWVKVPFGKSLMGPNHQRA